MITCEERSKATDGERAASAPAQAGFELVAGLGPDAIDRELRLADRQTDVGSRRLAFYLADMEARGVCQLLGYPTATAYAVSCLELGRRHAQQLIAVGRALEELPAIDAAFCRGSVNWSRVRLLVKIAVAETEAAWLDRCLALRYSDFEREVLTSERGRAPRQGRKGLPQIKIGVRAKLGRLDYEAWELAKKKLSEERGDAYSDGEFMAAAARLILGTAADGSVPGRTRLLDSNYRIVVDRCSECAATSLQTEDGPADLTPEEAARIACDAMVVSMAEPDADDAPADLAGATARGAEPDVGPTTARAADRSVQPSPAVASEPVVDDAPASSGHPAIDIPTPAWLRAKVLMRDGFACRVCRSRDGIQAHHVIWRSRGGRTRADNMAALCVRCHALVHDRLLRVKGVAPHGIEICRGDGSPLEWTPLSDRFVVRRAPEHVIVDSVAARPEREVGEVVFAALPKRVTPEWWARHAHLFTWVTERGEFRFEAGHAVDPVIAAGAAAADVAECGDERPPRPATLDDIIGQKRVVDGLRVAVKAARARGTSLDHVLLLGESGLGKTTLARAAAAAAGASVSVTSGPLIKDPAVLIRILTSLEPRAVLFVDEIHGLPRVVAESLYEAMEDRVLRLPVTDGHSGRTLEVGLNPFTLMGATTEFARVPQPLHSRFTIHEHLDAYEEGEVASIVTRAVEGDRLAIDGAAAAEIARFARGAPRRALALSRRVQDLAHAEGVPAIDTTFARDALARCGIDESGLGTMERKALDALLRHGRGRPMGVARWASTSGMCAAVLRQMCEPILVRLGLIAVTPRGRMAV